MHLPGRAMQCLSRGVRRLAQRLRLLELCQLRVTLVDWLEIERLLEAGVVEVELLVQLRDEPVGPVAEVVEVGGGQWGGCARHSS